MGPWKRRIAEKVRQNYGVTIDRGFKPTSNARLAATFNETKRFADALRRYDKQTSIHLKGLKDFTKQTNLFLSFQVPRMHKEGKPGEAMPAEGESIVGAEVDFEKITASATDGEEKIYKYVQEPLRKWLANFDTVVIALQTVEQLRLTVDSRRRTVSAFEGDITNLQTKTSDPEDPRLMKLVERKHRQDVKLSQVLDDFHTKEVTTYQNMRHLVNDVKYVQQHILKLFDLLRQVSSDVCDAFPPTGQMPGEARTTFISGPPENGFAYNESGSDNHYSDVIPAHHNSGALDAAETDEDGNQIDGALPLPYGNIDRYGERHVQPVNQSAYNPV